jgi:hypothetical protein
MIVAVGVAPSVTSPATAGPDGEYLAYGPSDPYQDAMMPWHGPVEPMVNQSVIERTQYGYMYLSGQQNNHLTVTRTTTGRLRYRDTGTKAWKRLATGCRAERVSTGISATCPVPAETGPSDALLLEFQVRLGNDFVDTRTLPAMFEAAVLGDEGNDVIYTGAGNDYITGAQDSDRISGGAGNDWLRSGIGDDVIVGGSGNDWLVGNEAADKIYGGSGDDAIYGSDGDDVLYGGSGDDKFYGGPGNDAATMTATSQAWTCEDVTTL